MSTGKKLQVGGTRRPRLENRPGHHCAREWGNVERRIAIGGKVYPDGGMVVDGWPPRSPSAQWKDGDGGTHRELRQVFPEVHNQDSLMVARALDRMTVVQRALMWLVYVEGRGYLKGVRDESGLSRDRFYAVLGTALDVVEMEIPEPDFAG